MKHLHRMVPHCFLVVAVISSGCSGILDTVDPVDGPQCEADGDCTTGFTCTSGRCSARPMAICVDEDGDGYFRGPGCDASLPQDCNDNDDAISPAESEVCNDGVDQNCMGGEDEGCECLDEGIGTSRTCGLGACRGSSVCQETGWGECNSGVVATPEDCGPDGTGNDIDEDCNGVADDGCDEFACPPRPDGMGDEEICFDMGAAVECSSNGTCFAGPG